MATEKTNIWVYAHWAGMPQPKCIGILSSQYSKGRRIYSFEYNKDWLKSEEQLILDPDIGWYSGVQYPVKKENFGMFLDSMPDSWGRTLMKRKASQSARAKGETPRVLHDIDFLLGVADFCRMGALRFKLDPDGPFLDNDKDLPVPPWTTVRELQHIAALVESDKDTKELKRWLTLLMAPGSSLGGARPKANIMDNKGHLWIAKFPSKNDNIDKAKWEFLTYSLAVKAGIKMSESKIENVTGPYATFFTKRFDRIFTERIHFASAMTVTGNNEDTIRDKRSSYLDLALFIQDHSGNVRKDLIELWRRIVFNIAVSNTDDHLRNHGFIIENGSWRLSPAFDVNPSIDKEELSLNIDEESGALDFDLALSVIEYFRLNPSEAQSILTHVLKTVSLWKKTAKQIGIANSEAELMRVAFRL